MLSLKVDFIFGKNNNIIPSISMPISSLNLIKIGSKLNPNTSWKVEYHRMINEVCSTVFRISCNGKIFPQKWVVNWTRRNIDLKSAFIGYDIWYDTQVGVRATLRVNFWTNSLLADILNDQNSLIAKKKMSRGQLHEKQIRYFQLGAIEQVGGLKDEQWQPAVWVPVRHFRSVKTSPVNLHVLVRRNFKMILK